jgi:putative transposase
LFFAAGDYQAFERVLREALDRIPIRLLAFCLMPNHWHLVLWPKVDELPRFMHWLTLTHAKRWHATHQSVSSGHVYQDRYHAVPVQSDLHLLSVLRYVERNALRAGLVTRAEEWRWGSLWRHCNFCDDVPLSEWPILRPHDWVDIVNEGQTGRDLADIQAAITSGRPIGDEDWSAAAAVRLGLPNVRKGRPIKKRQA